MPTDLKTVSIGLQNAQQPWYDGGQLGNVGLNGGLSSGSMTTSGNVFNGGNYITYPLIYQILYPALQQQPWAMPDAAYLKRLLEEIEALNASTLAAAGEPEEPCVSQEEIRANGGLRKIEV